MTDSHMAFERLVQRLDPHGRLLRTWPLTGGVSAQVTALEYERSDGHRVRVIVRQHGEADLARNPRIAADEFRLLQTLKAAGLAVPMPYAVDDSGEIFAAPALAVEYIDGLPEFEPAHLTDAIYQLAAHLARVHSVETAIFDVSFVPQKIDFYSEKLAKRPHHLDSSLNERRIRDTLNSVWPLSQKNPSVLLHGDFWPGNILWKEGQIVGIIDWEDAALGDPLIDLANSRLEVLWAFGLEAMQQFTHDYTAIMPRLDISNLTYWDLCAALRPIASMATWTDDIGTQQMMRDRHRLFVTQAFEHLS